MTMIKGLSIKVLYGLVLAAAIALAATATHAGVGAGSSGPARSNSMQDLDGGNNDSWYGRAWDSVFGRPDTSSGMSQEEAQRASDEGISGPAYGDRSDLGGYDKNSDPNHKD